MRHKATLWARQQAITELSKDYRYETLQSHLQAIGDCERILARVALKTARPRDLSRLREVFAELPDLQQAMAILQTPKLRALAEHISEFPVLHDVLVRADAVYGCMISPIFQGEWCDVYAG